MQITDSLFVAYSQCTYKAFLKFKGEVGEVVDYEAIQTEADVRGPDPKKRSGGSTLRVFLP